MPRKEVTLLSQSPCKLLSCFRQGKKKKDMVHLFNKYLLSTYYVSANGLDAWDTSTNKSKIPPSLTWGVERENNIKHKKQIM